MSTGRQFCVSGLPPCLPAHEPALPLACVPSRARISSGLSHQCAQVCARDRLGRRAACLPWSAPRPAY
eukprot:8536113-Alexandrium_andersonii.AAC.1